MCLSSPPLPRCSFPQSPSPYGVTDVMPYCGPSPTRLTNYMPYMPPVSHAMPMGVYSLSQGFGGMPGPYMTYAWVVDVCGDAQLQPTGPAYGMCPPLMCPSVSAATPASLLLALAQSEPCIDTANVSSAATTVTTPQTRDTVEVASVWASGVTA
ncbi:MAG: hypothetical protein P4L40_14005 [Terracidiphilus sp.]|nr:hypothetical protein [Terracidiphilus sp.]